DEKTVDVGQRAYERDRKQIDLARLTAERHGDTLGDLRLPDRTRFGHERSHCRERFVGDAGKSLRERPRRVASPLGPKWVDRSDAPVGIEREHAERNALDELFAAFAESCRRLGEA